MKKFLYTLTALLALFVAASGASAAKVESGPAAKRVTASAVQSGKVKTIPLSLRQRSVSPAAPSVFRAMSMENKRMRVAPAAAPGIRYPEIMGSVVYSDHWKETGTAQYGVFTIPTSADKSFERRISESAALNGGGVRVGDTYYAVEYRESYGNYYVYMNYYDLGTLTRRGYKTVDMSYVAPGGLALDPTTNTVYGIFYTEDMKRCVFATLDVTGDEFSKNTICMIPEDIDVVAVACDAAGQLYAITRTIEDITSTGYRVVESTLCKLDKATGALDPIGETGMFPYYPTAAVIDSKSGRMFWTVSPSDGTGNLCEVDLKTGQASVVYSFPDNEQVCGLYIADPLAEDKAPDAVSNIELDFPEGSLKGTVSFDVPSTTFDGTPVQGDVNYKITVNGKSDLTGTTTYGTRGVIDVTLTEPGDYTFNVSLSNEAGVSPVKMVSSFIGVGVPKTPVITATKTGNTVEISWEPVTEVIDKGYINPDGVVYNVQRFPDKVMIAEGISQTSCTDMLPEPDGLEFYHYTVTAVYDGSESASAETEPFMCGVAKIPYYNSFLGEDNLLGYTIIDANKDDKSWIPSYSNSVCVWYNSSMSMDDWLITPPVRLEAGYIYPVSIEVACQDGSTTERVEVMLGNDVTVSSMTAPVIDPSDINGTAATTLSGFAIPTASGIYHLGIHGISDPDQYKLHLYNVSIGTGIMTPVPAAPSLTILADPTGADNVKIDITAPSVDLQGNPLESITKIILSRDGKVINTFDNPAPGQNLDYQDTGVATGRHMYTAVAYCDKYKGNAATASAFVGFDKPAVPASVEIVETAVPGEVTLSWAPVTADANGKPLKNVTYNIYKFDGTSPVLCEEGITETSWTFMAVEEGQEFMQCAVRAVNESGEGSAIISEPILAGTPYSTPYTEHFDLQNVGVLGVNVISENAEIGLTTDEMSGLTSVDGDTYMLLTGGEKGDYLTALTGKFDLSGLVVPGMTIYVYSYGNDNGNAVTIYAGEPNTELKPMQSVTLGSLGDAGWKMITTDLKEFAGKTIQLGIGVTFDNYDLVAFDVMRLRNLADHDLVAAGIDGPAKALQGREFSVDVDVLNDGLKTVDNFTVTLYRDGEPEMTLPGTDIAPDAHKVITFTTQLNAMTGEPAEYSAAVVLDTDVDANNNTTGTIKVAPKATQLPAVTDLAGESTADGNMLTWSEPDMAPIAPVEVTLDFEDEKSWAKHLDEWIFIDNDGKPAGGFKNFDIPGVTVGETTTSFLVFDNTLPCFNEGFDTHSGNKCLATLWRHDGGATNDWAILPELTGEAQTVTLWARSYHEIYYEQMQIMYSDTDTNLESFKQLEYVEKVPAEWTCYTVNVPEGAKYLAIHSSSSENYMLFVDDITFTPAPALKDFALVGYNVYVDGKHTAVSEENEYLHTPVSDYHAYAVTAKYDLGESAPSNVVTLETSGVDGVSGKADVTIIGAGGNIIVIGAEGLDVTVSTVDGKTIYNAVASGRTVISSGTGCFLVSVSGRTAKIAVK